MNQQRFLLANAPETGPPFFTPEGWYWVWKTFEVPQPSELQTVSLWMLERSAPDPSEN